MKNVTLTPAPQPATRLERDSLRLAPHGPAVKTLVAATAVALMLLPGVRSARAQAIGDIDVRSRLGERFFAAVPVRSNAVLDPNCIRVGANPAAPEGADPLRSTRVRINPTGPVESVIIETAGSVTSPVIALRLEVGCTNPVVRDFVVLGEGVPLQVQAEQPPVAPVAVATRIAPPRAARAPRARVAPPAPRGRPTASGPDSILKAPVVTSHSSAPSVVGATTAPAAPTTPTIAVPQDGQSRVAELRARSDDQAASLLDLEDRLSLLQKQAELLKAQLEQVLATPTPTADSAATPASTSPVTLAPATAGTTVGVAASTASVFPANTVRKSRSIGELLTDWRVVGGALGALLCAAIAYKLGRRNPARSVRTAPSAAAVRQDPSPRNVQPAAQKSLELDRTPLAGAALPIPDMKRTPQRGKTSQPLVADATMEWDARPPTTNTHAVPESSARAAATATHPGMDVSREFHITQQFQPSAERTVALSTPEEIVQQARTLYMDDGDTFRAIDLLEMAVSVRTDSTRPWQALFAIYRRENMLERYQRLALAYRQAFGEDSNWTAIQILGHALDSSNALYSVPENAEPLPDDQLERWLGVPLDFTSHLLANEMHDQLMETFPGRAKKRKRVAGE
jgi:hypothetical protein